MNIINSLLIGILAILYFVFVFPFLCLYRMPENIRLGREQRKKAEQQKKEAEESRKLLMETIEHIRTTMEQTRNSQLDAICIAFDDALTDYIANTLDGTKARVEQANERMRAVMKEHGDELQVYLKPFQPILHLEMCPHNLKNYHFRTAYNVFRKKE